MEKQFKKIVLEWIEKNYGGHERHDPCYDIKALAKELDEHFHELYWQQELEYLKEDVENYVDGLNEYELTEKQMYAVADKIRNSDWYCSIDPEDMEYYIREELKKGDNLYYLLNEDGTRLTDEDGNYLKPVTLEEAKRAVDAEEASNYEEADRFELKQGY